MAHELEHAQWIEKVKEGLFDNPESEYWNNEWSKLWLDPQESDSEEKRVATDSNSLEVKTAESLGQGVRSDYTNPIDVEYVGCPTCTIPLQDSELSSKQKENEKLLQAAVKASKETKK